MKLRIIKDQLYRVKVALRKVRESYNRDIVLAMDDDADWEYESESLTDTDADGTDDTSTIVSDATYSTDELLKNFSSSSSTSLIQTQIEPIVLPPRQLAGQYQNLPGSKVQAFLQAELEERGNEIIIMGFHHLEDFLNFIKKKYMVRLLTTQDSTAHLLVNSSFNKVTIYA